MRKLRLVAAAGLAIISAQFAFGGEQVPFKAVIQTRPEILGVGLCESGVPACLQLAIPGDGTATQMGKVAVAGPSFVNLSTGLQTGSFTFTAANGDQISA